MADAAVNAPTAPTSGSPLRVGVLGPLQVERDGAQVSLRPRERQLLAALALDPERGWSIDDLIGAIWSDEVPATAAKALHNHIARTRRTLGAEIVSTVDGGYTLGGDVAIDARLAEADYERGLSALVGRRPDHALERFQTALGAWRGVPFPELPNLLDASIERERLASLLALLEEHLAATLLVLGRPTEAAAAATSIVHRDPFRERGWLLLALSQYRDEQRRASLQTFARCRRVLADEVGVVPGAALEHLEDRIRRDDPALVADSAGAVLRLIGLWDVDGDGHRPTDAAQPEPMGDAPGVDRSEPLPGHRHRRATPVETIRHVAALADEASQRHGPADARALRQQLRLARELRIAGDRRCRTVLVAVGDSAIAAGDDELLVEVALEACATGPTTMSGDLDTEVARLIDAGLAACDDDRRRARLSADATILFSLAGHPERLRRSFDTALQLSAGVDDVRLRCDVLGAAYVSLVHPADWPLRRDVGDEFLALAEQLGEPDAIFQALHLSFSNQVISGDPMWRTTLDRVVRLAAEIDLPVRRWMADYQRACLAALTGERDEADRIARDMRLQSPVDVSRVLTSSLMARVAAAGSGTPDSGLVAEIDEVIVDQDRVIGWRAVGAWLAALRGDEARALSDFETILDRGGLDEDMTWSGATTLLARAFVLLGDRERAQEVRSWLAPHSGYMSWYGAGSVGPIDLALAEVDVLTGDVDRAVHHAEIARRLVDRLGARVYDDDLRRLDSSLGRRANTSRTATSP